jgi:hypothetical protein
MLLKVFIEYQLKSKVTIHQIKNHKNFLILEVLLLNLFNLIKLEMK